MGNEHGAGLGVKVTSIETEYGMWVWTAETAVDGRLVLVLASSETTARSLLAKRVREILEASEAATTGRRLAS